MVTISWNYTLWMKLCDFPFHTDTQTLAHICSVRFRHLYNVSVCLSHIFPYCLFVCMSWWVFLSFACLSLLHGIPWFSFSRSSRSWTCVNFPPSAFFVCILCVFSCVFPLLFRMYSLCSNVLYAIRVFSLFFVYSFACIHHVCVCVCLHEISIVLVLYFRKNFWVFFSIPDKSLNEAHTFWTHIVHSHKLTVLRVLLLAFFYPSDRDTHRHRTKNINICTVTVVDLWTIHSNSGWTIEERDSVASLATFFTWIV